MTQPDQIDPIIRLIEAGDSIAELTELLHRAYAPLAAMGLHYHATYQDQETTRKRIADAECYLAIHDGKMIGTLTWREAARTGGSLWYDRADVASCGQFGVEPAFKGKGIGGLLLAIAECRTLESGAKELALDTAETAEHLLKFYISRGYRPIEHVQWERANYRSLLLSKRVGGS